jgi:hypothetical protein
MTPPRRNPKRAKGKTYDVDEPPEQPPKLVYRKSRTRIWMILIFVGIVGILSVLLFITLNPPEVDIIEQYDVAKLEYFVWTEENYDNDRTKVSISNYSMIVNVTTRYDNKVDGGLIKGFYDEILGKTVGYQKILWLNRTVDLDKDGKDDYTGYDAKSYGFPEDGELFNKTIVISYRILTIQKSGIPK